MANKKVTSTDYKNAQKVIDKYQCLIYKYVNDIKKYLVDVFSTTTANVAIDDIGIINYEDYLKFCIYSNSVSNLIATMKISMEVMYKDIDSNEQSYKYIKIEHE